MQTEIPWTEQQSAVFERTRSTKDSLMVTSVAGSGKSTTLAELATHLTGSVLALAFNVRIKKGMEERIGSFAVCKTLNGVGHGALCKLLGRGVAIDKDKVRKIVRALLNESENKHLWELFSSISALASRAKHHGLIPKGTPGMFKALVEDTLESWEEIALHYDIDFDQDIYRLARLTLRQSNTMAFKGICDFDDQIYVCQPPGTMVLLTAKGVQGCQEKPIENIVVGDSVVSYNRRISKLTGYYNHGSKVVSAQEIHYEGNLFSIATSDTSTEATAQHRWLVRMKRKRLWAVYLMRRGASWRIGQTALHLRAYGQSAVLGVVKRAREEGGEAVWILCTTDSLEAARILEETLSTRFGISQATFKDDYGRAIHEALGNMTKRALAALHEYGRREDCPLWPSAIETREGGRIVVDSQRNFEHPTLIESCNLVPSFMYVPEVYGKEIEWVKFSVQFRHYRGPVYALEIHRHGLYVADLLLTHNSALWGAPFPGFDNVIVDEAQDLSEIQHKIIAKILRLNGRLIAVGDENQAIYGFRAAMSNSIRRLVDTFDLDEMELTISFRCCQSVVREAQQVVPRIEASPSAPEGLVIDYASYAATTFKTGDCVLCRNNAPLIKLAYKLIREGVGVHVLGRDIGTGLKLLAKRIVGKDLTQPINYLIQGLLEWQAQETGKAQAKEQLSKVEAINDKAESLHAIIEGSGAKTIQDVIDEIDRLFGKTSAPITLSTIHRAKGLEWDRVFFLNPHLIPSIWARKAHDRDPRRYEWMMQEERNLRYVGITRAKLELAYITTEGWKNGTS